jgi:hypothetical protein
MAADFRGARGASLADEPISKKDFRASPLTDHAYTDIVEL